MEFSKLHWHKQKAIYSEIKLNKLYFHNRSYWWEAYDWYKHQLIVGPCSITTKGHFLWFWWQFLMPTTGVNVITITYCHMQCFNIIMLLWHGFTLTDLVGLGTHNDGGVFTKSSFGTALENGQMGLPSSLCLPGTTVTRTGVHNGGWWSIPFEELPFMTISWVRPTRY